MEEEVSRVGCKWTFDEDLNLKKKVEDKKSYEEIALNHKRSINAIKLRVIDKIIYNEYKNDKKSLEELSINYNIEKDFLERQINKIEINNSIKNNREKIDGKWSNEEDLILKKELDDKKTYEEIALNHNRTVNSIKDRIKKNYYDNNVYIRNIEKKLENIEKKLDLIIYTIS